MDTNAREPLTTAEIATLEAASNIIVKHKFFMIPSAFEGHIYMSFKSNDGRDCMGSALTFVDAYAEALEKEATLPPKPLTVKEYREKVLESISDEGVKSVIADVPLTQ